MVLNYENVNNTNFNPHIYEGFENVFARRAFISRPCNPTDKHVLENIFARRAFISIENKITNKHGYAVGVSYK